MTATATAARSGAMDANPVNPFLGQNVYGLLLARAKTHAQRNFLTWMPNDGEPRRWTYRAFAEEVRRVAGGLQALGVSPGQRVILHADNSPEFLLAWFALAATGATAVTTNARSTPGEMQDFVTRTRAVGALTQAALADVFRATPDLPWLLLMDGGMPATDGLPQLRAWDIVVGSAEYRDFEPAHEDEFGIQFTSGTTAQPKGVVWTHANALWGARTGAAHQALTPEDVYLVHLPLFHTNAQSYSVLSALWAGASMVLLPRFSASRFWDVSTACGCTWTSMVPFCARALLSQPRPASHRYRFWGYPVSEAPTDAPLGVRSLGWWGMTETVTHGIVGSVHEHNRAMTMGKPAAGYDIVIETEPGVPARPGQTGDLLVRGVRGLSLFKEYLDDPSATAAAFDERGLFRTGDRVTLLPDGSIAFADRDKDMLKVGGENVSASEIERVAMAVEGVAECAVVGAPHAMLDEVPVAFVIARPQASVGDLPERVLAACRQHLARFKQPAAVILVAELPRVTLGKVAKSQLRAALKARGLQAFLDAHAAEQHHF